MRRDPVTQKTFEPQNAEQLFIDKESFLSFISTLDPLDTFEINKRKIGWEPIERSCRQCGKTFIAEHPAMHYCEEHRASSVEVETADEEPKRRIAPLEYFKPKIRACVNCNRDFISTTPAMRYCEECSDKGGKLIETKFEK